MDYSSNAWNSADGDNPHASPWGSSSPQQQQRAAAAAQNRDASPTPTPQLGRGNSGFAEGDAALGVQGLGHARGNSGFVGETGSAGLGEEAGNVFADTQRMRASLDSSDGGFGGAAATRTASDTSGGFGAASTARASMDSSGGFAEPESRLSDAETVVENGRASLQNTTAQVAAEGEQQGQQQPPQQQQQQPRQQPRPQQRYHAQRPKSRQEQPAYKLQPRVTGLERPSRKDLLMRFDVYTNLPGYRTTQFRDVRRTYVEFTRLADHLISANPECLVPALPPPSTPAGVGTDEDEARTKTSMQRWLTVVCSNDVLMKDEEIVRFIEGDPGYSPVMRRSQPATGVRRKVLKQFAPPPDDSPELQEARPVAKRLYLAASEAGMRVDRSVKARRALSVAESEFGQRLGQLAEHEVHSGLKHGYRKLGRTVQAVGDLHAAQGTAEATVFGEPLAYAAADAFIVKETLTNRHLLLRDLDQAKQATQARLGATDRLKASSSVRRDKVDEAIAALEEARSHETYLQAKSARVTSNLVNEQRAWFTRTAADVRASVRELVLREIDAERRALATLEAVRADVRAIDASGGLSRLGREGAPAAARRAPAHSSQGPRGDAWSGVTRRSTATSATSSAIVKQDGGAPAAEGAEGEAAETNRPGSNGGPAVGAAAGIQDDDSDRVDAKNAASRLASSTF